MVIHVGIDLFGGKISSYDASNKKYNNYEITPVKNESDINKIDEIFNDIKLKGELGCLCAVKEDCDDKVRIIFFKKFIESCLLHGFKKVQIIDWRSAQFYSAVSYSNNYKFGANDFIVAHTQLDTFFVWQNKNGVVKEKKQILIRPNIHVPPAHGNNSLKSFFAFTMIGTIGSIFERPAEIRNITKSDPNVMFHLNKYDAPVIKQYFPSSTFIEYANEANMGALHKARIMGNDMDIHYFDVETHFGTSIIVNLNNKEIMRIEYGDVLPLMKIVVTQLLTVNRKITVLSANGSSKNYTLPKFSKILIMLEIESDKSFSIKCMDLSKDVGNKLEAVVRRRMAKMTTYDEISDVYNIPAKIQVNNDCISAVGIDLGTTRCCAAVNRKNKVETVALDNRGERQLPSWIGYDEENPKCGQLVIDRLRNYANSSVFDAKRIIGKTFKEIKIDKSWPFKIEKLCFLELTSNEKHKKVEEIVLSVKSCNNFTLKYPEEISAVLLKHIKKKAEEFQGLPLSEAVITVPASFNQNQMQATYDAAILAGWEEVFLLPEPVAAAFAYFIDQPIPNNSTLLLFDLGGGTLDVCIFKIQNNKLEIISRTGDPNIGGRDFDNLLVNYFDKEISRVYRVAITEGRKHKLLQKCQNIKESLTTLQEDILDTDDIDPTMDKNIPVTRKEFEKMAADLLKSIKDNIMTALEKINFEPENIDKVLQVGGGCRMPMIKNLLKEIFPTSEHCVNENPDEVVAIGAAYCSYYLNQEDRSWCSIM